jgi:hypothetical protein
VGPFPKGKGRGSAPVLHYTFVRTQREGRRRGRGGDKGGWGGCCAARPWGDAGWLEVGEAPLRRAPPVGERVREGEGEGELEWVGGGCWAGIEVVGRCGNKRKRKLGRRRGGGPRGEMGQAGFRERREEERF